MELKSIRLHEVLKTIPKTFVDFQKKKHMDPVSITLGNITKEVVIKTPCFFIIGDMQGKRQNGLLISILFKLQYTKWYIWIYGLSKNELFYPDGGVAQQTA